MSKTDKAEAIRWREESAAEWERKARTFDERADYWTRHGLEHRADDFHLFAAEARGNALVLRTEVRALLAPALVAEMAAG